MRLEQQSCMCYLVIKIVTDAKNNLRDRHYNEETNDYIFRLRIIVTYSSVFGFFKYFIYLLTK